MVQFRRKKPPIAVSLTVAGNQITRQGVASKGGGNSSVQCVTCGFCDADIWLDAAAEHGVEIHLKTKVNGSKSICFSVGSETEQLDWLRTCRAGLVKQHLETTLVPTKNLKLGGVLGRGAFGTVRRAELYDGAAGSSSSSTTTTTVAMKTLSMTAAGSAAATGMLATAFLNEAAILSRLNCPFLLRYHGLCVFESGGEYAILAEYCPHGTLNALIHELDRNGHISGPGKRELPAELYLKLSHDLFSGLTYLHNHEVVHRDLKPDNLLLSADMGLKISDFGSARAEATSRFMTANTVGSMLWRAPEVYTGVLSGSAVARSSRYGSKVDIYSAGIILWEMFTRLEPYKDVDSNFALQQGVCDGTLRPPLRALPPRLASLCQRCWALDPRDRPSAVEVGLWILRTDLLDENGDLDGKDSVKIDRLLQALNIGEAAFEEGTGENDPAAPGGASPVAVSDSYLCDGAKLYDTEPSGPGRRPSTGGGDYKIAQRIRARARARTAGKLLCATDIPAIVSAMREPFSDPEYRTGGLRVQCNKWLFFTVPNSFIGIEMLRWVEANVQVASKQEAVAVCESIVDVGFCRHTFKRLRFSKTCAFFWLDRHEVHQLLAVEETLRTLQAAPLAALAEEREEKQQVSEDSSEFIIVTRRDATPPTC